MKSRLTMRLLVVVSVRPSDMKKRGLVTHVSERPAVLPKVYTRSPGQPTKPLPGVARVGRAAVLGRSAGATRQAGAGRLRPALWRPPPALRRAPRRRMRSRPEAGRIDAP